MKEKRGDKRKEEVFRLKEKAKGKEARKGVRVVSSIKQ